jgi:hypothetical protein
VPAGRYRVMDGRGNPVGTESFRCAPGPAGWRYFSEIETSIPEPHREQVDFVVDSGWRPVRLVVRTGRHDLVVQPSADVLTGTLDGEAVEIPFGPEVELDYLSPCFNAVTAIRLGETREIDVIFFEPVTCLPRPMRQRYELQDPEDEVVTPVGFFTAARWIYTAIESGFSRPMWVAGDVVVAYEDVFELEELDPGPRGPFPR